MTEIHDDPMKEGAAVAVGLASELAGVVMATQSLQLRLIGLKPDKDAPLEEPDDLDLDLPELSSPELRTAQASARFNWQPALKDDWLADASAVEAARAWSAALPFADAEPSAALAMARSEARLAEINPEAMAGYQQLRSEGMAPADAMLQASSLFEKPSASAQLSHDPLLAGSSLSSRTSARSTHDLGLDNSATLGPENPISLNLDQPAHHAKAGEAFDQVLGAKPSGARSRPGFEDDGPEVDLDLDEAPVLAGSMSPDTAQSASQDDLAFGAGAPADAAPVIDGPDPQAGADVPNLSPEPPQSSAARAAEISMRTFPESSAAADRTPNIQPVSRPAKKKTLGKVLRRGGRR